MILKGRINGTRCNIWVKDETVDIQETINCLRKLRVEVLSVIPNSNCNFEEIMSHMTLVYTEEKLYQISKGKQLMINFPIRIDGSEVHEEFKDNDILRSKITSKIFMTFPNNKSISIRYNTTEKRFSVPFEYKIKKNKKHYELHNLIDGSVIKLK